MKVRNVRMTGLISAMGAVCVLTLLVDWPSLPSMREFDLYSWLWIIHPILLLLPLTYFLLDAIGRTPRSYFYAITFVGTAVVLLSVTYQLVPILFERESSDSEHWLALIPITLPITLVSSTFVALVLRKQVSQ